MMSILLSYQRKVRQLVKRFALWGINVAQASPPVYMNEIAIEETLRKSERLFLGHFNGIIFAYSGEDA
jgi:hypothetical protein